MPVCGTARPLPASLCCISSLLCFSLFLSPQSFATWGPGGNVTCMVQSLASEKHSERCQGGDGPQCPWVLFCERLGLDILCSLYPLARLANFGFNYLFLWQERDFSLLCLSCMTYSGRSQQDRYPSCGGLGLHQYSGSLQLIYRAAGAGITDGLCLPSSPAESLDLASHAAPLPLPATAASVPAPG